ncbi:glutathione S-transferase family protein [Aurantimonas endophytica]|uniref:Glutathione S-transferase n=1 Tax=Aurantimonas endophytica TaxID=1522175 RepID=A0A7W6HHD5_9HYPH|nr:glutathione S-transferase family protein [Aurantimonas endophytica]MBB4005213.1 glutathione S-transferase [Aurantimonas endophytica]MCO6406124.1 glutathione S-transferase family protein [Aurantimonas endophytica]
MPVDPQAAVEISAFRWVPPFAQGLVRDLRVRWALEEAGAAYRVRLLDALSERPHDYFQEQPFGQVPVYRDADVRLFESGAIVLHIAEGTPALMPGDRPGRARTAAWVFAALNSIEPVITELATIDLFHPDADWARIRRPEVETKVRTRLGRLSDRLAGRQYLEDQFTAGDLMMTTVLRNLRHTELVAADPVLAPYQARCEARPAFKRALEAQLAPFHQGEPAEMA